MKERQYWRKTARLCPKCHKLQSAGRFIPELDGCVQCEFDNFIWKEYKSCTYCRRFQKIEQFPKRRHKKRSAELSSHCRDCLEAARKRGAIFKNAPKLHRNNRYVCRECGISKSHFSYSRGTSPENPLCKTCITNQKIETEGKFRCRGCCSVFLKGECRINKYCGRCYEKNKKWNREKQKTLRKDPKWIEYFKQFSRYYYYQIIKPIYNKTFALQWEHGLVKKRGCPKKSTWYCLNNQLFADFKKRPLYWMEMTERVIQKMKKGKLREDAAQRTPYNRLANNPEWEKDMGGEWN